MGRRGYAQVKRPEYGSCISDWAQHAFCRYLEEHGLEVGTGNGNDWVGPADADRWEIEIPYKKTKPDSKMQHSYVRIRRMIKELREHPDRIVDYDGHNHGEAAARVLEECLEAAIRENNDYLVIEWF